MLCVIPYKDFGGSELKYCLRGIEKYVPGAEVILVGGKPDWVQNVEHIYHHEEKELQYKEKNIFEKLLLVKRDFLFFNDDHFLLQPFDKNTYHHTGRLSTCLKQYDAWNQFRNTLFNTFYLVGDVDNYFRHGPIFCKYNILEKINTLNWEKGWGYCVKSLYCHFANIKGTEYPDLKIRYNMTLTAIRTITRDRQYFSTGNHCMNADMLAFLKETYPDKSKFEK